MRCWPRGAHGLANGMRMEQRRIPIHDQRDGLALLVDGDNIGASHVDEILKRSGREGPRRVFRVYGDATRCPQWTARPGAHFIHAAGQNAADFTMSIDAAHLMHAYAIRRFMIASSDGDFSHIATYLVEQGCQVLGLGEAKTPPAFREACTGFFEIGAPSETDQIIEALRQIIRQSGQDGALITEVNGKMRGRLDIKISERPEKNWRGFLAQHKSDFVMDPKGPNSRVRLK